MRIVIDMQGAQSVSHNRGIGRYTLAITKGLVRNCGKHQIVFALNGNFTSTIEPLRAAFASLLPADSIRVWYSCVPVSAANTSSNWRQRAAELTYESFLASLEPDFIYITSLFEGLNDDAVTSIHSLQNNVPVAVTIYDFIPYLNQNLYLDNHILKAWYMGKVEHLRKADLWLAISESSRREGIDSLGLSDTWSVNISADADALFHPISVTIGHKEILRTRYGLSKPFIMYTGGVDCRKNVEGLTRAFSKLPKPLRCSHQLVIVCAMAPARRKELLRYIQKQGLTEQDVVLTGFVPDQDLLILYNLCKLFVFPSWHEGFGLPVLEAIRCGAPVIGANAASIPEIIAWNEALFDPHSDESIAQHIERGLVDETFRQALLRNGKQQAQKFSWDSSARQAIAAIERKRQEWDIAASVRIPKRPKMAYISPLQLIHSDIAKYSAELLPELCKFYDIDVIVEQDDTADAWDNEICPVRTLRWFYQHTSQYDRVLYHFGNSKFHQHMFQLLADVPGVVALHDFFLSEALACIGQNSLTTHVWLNALYHSHGHVALYDSLRTDGLTEIISKYPCCLEVIQNALGIIVHSPSSVRLAEQWYATRASNWTVIPHLHKIRKVEGQGQARKKLGIDSNDFLVCSFGRIDSTKLNHRLLQAWQNSSLANSPSCHLIFVGENDPGDYGKSLHQSIKNHKAGGCIHITGSVDTSVLRDYLISADIAVQLRCLTRGETSRTVLDCMGYAKPTIVNANGSMADLNPDTVWMLPDEFTIAQLVQALENLYQDAMLRERLGKNAQNAILACHKPQTCAEQYYHSVEKYYQNAQSHASVLSKAIANHMESVNETQLAEVASTIARSIPPSFRCRQLLIDVSADTGLNNDATLQSQIKSWLKSPPSGFRVEPVHTLDNRQYLYAHSFVSQLLDYEQILHDNPIDYWPGDIFIGSETSKHTFSSEKNAIQKDMLRQGVTLKSLEEAQKFIACIHEQISKK